VNLPLHHAHQFEMVDKFRRHVQTCEAAVIHFKGGMMSIVHHTHDSMAARHHFADDAIAGCQNICV
jgi:hypothetical protein